MDKNEQRTNNHGQRRVPAETLLGSNMLDDQISITELGIALKSFNNLHKATMDWENKSIVEDNENHFHVDWHIQPADNKNAFMLGIKTLILLADKFQKEKVSGIRFWYSFQTPELGALWANQNNVDDDDDEHFISDRLSFYKRRAGEEEVSTEQMESKYWAMLMIDI